MTRPACAANLMFEKCPPSLELCSPPQVRSRSDLIGPICPALNPILCSKND